MVFWTASVSRVALSPRAPKSVTRNGIASALAPCTAASMLRAPLRVLVEHLLAPRSQPGIADAAFALDLGEGVFLHAVAAAEERAIRVDLVVPRPQRRGGRVVDQHDVVVLLLQALAGDLRLLRP